MKKMISMLLISLLVLSGCSKQEATGPVKIVTTNKMSKLLIEELILGIEDITVDSLSLDYTYTDHEISDTDKALLQEASVIVFIGSNYDADLIAKIPSELKEKTKTISLGSELSEVRLKSIENSVDVLKNKATEVDIGETPDINIDDFFKPDDSRHPNLYIRFKLENLNIEQIGTNINTEDFSSLRDYFKNIKAKNSTAKLEVLDDDTGNKFIFSSPSDALLTLKFDSVVLKNGDVIDSNNKEGLDNALIHTALPDGEGIPEQVEEDVEEGEPVARFMSAQLPITGDEDIPYVNIAINTYGSNESFNVMAETFVNKMIELFPERFDTQLKANLTTFKIKLGDLLDLHKGDVNQFEYPIILYIGNTNVKQFNDWYQITPAYASLIDEKSPDGKKNMSKILDYLSNHPSVPLVVDNTIMNETLDAIKAKIPSLKIIELDFTMKNSTESFIPSLDKLLTSLAEGIH